MTNEELEIISKYIQTIGDSGIFVELGSDIDVLKSKFGNKFPNWKFVTIQELDVDQKASIVRISIIGKKIAWQEIYSSATNNLNDNGIVISCNCDHPKYSEFIEQSIKNVCLIQIEKTNGIIVSKNNPIKYGSFEANIDLNYHTAMSNELLNSSKVKSSGLNNHNSFINLLPEDKKSLSLYLNSLLKSNFEWNFEYFKSGEPAGLHTDYISIPNSWKPKEMGIITHDCHIVIGVIIPLEWNCKQPYTVNYNRISNVPRKLKYKNGEMRYLDNDEIFEYRDKWVYDEEVLKYNPKKTEYYKEYADLTVHSVYEWKRGTMLIFDTRRWHSSSWFLSTEKVPEVSTEYKKSIIGFGSIDVDRNRIDE